jgi:PEGA domain-containing protein
VNPKRVLGLVPALVPAAVLTLWPVEADAQHGHAHVSVGIGVGFGYGYGHPFYGAPYFYNPYWWGFNGFWGYPYAGYPYGPYPYPPYGYGYYDPSSDLRLQVTPRTAEVYVDGYLVGTVDDFDGVFQRVHMPFGEHEVAIYAPGYHTIAQRMLFRPFQSYKIKDTLQPLGAGVADDPRPTAAPRPQRQQPQGPPPYEPPVGPPPQYQYRAPAGPPPAESRDPNQVQVEPGADRFGSIAVRVQPADAEVLIDGDRWEASNGERVLVHLSDGMHRVEVRKPGYVPYTSSVRIRTGETVTLNVSLTKQ